MIEIEDSSKPTVVREIEAFLGSLAGKYYQQHYADQIRDRTDFLIDSSVDNNFTPFTREGFIGEIRQLREDSKLLQNLKTQLVEEIKESNINKETNGS